MSSILLQQKNFLTPKISSSEASRLTPRASVRIPNTNSGEFWDITSIWRVYSALSTKRNMAKGCKIPCIFPEGKFFGEESGGEIGR
uniref:Uncharacterized protein n=1 Tax=Medicago truncatula TaxID=3880 RepID=B7FKM4_MEDTR|nr:unknown [Medicago truncatula]